MSKNKGRYSSPSVSDTLIVNSASSFPPPPYNHCHSGLPEILLDSGRSEDDGAQLLFFSSCCSNISLAAGDIDRCSSALGVGAKDTDLGWSFFFLRGGRLLLNDATTGWGSVPAMS